MGDPLYIILESNLFVPLWPFARRSLGFEKRSINLLEMLKRVHYIFYCHWLDYLISCFHNLDPRCSLMSNHYLAGCCLCWLFCIHFCWWHWKSIGEMKKYSLWGLLLICTLHFGKFARIWAKNVQIRPSYISSNLILSAFEIKVSVAFFWRHWFICHVLKHTNPIIWVFEFWQLFANLSSAAFLPLQACALSCQT